jgi:cytochrome c oxidase subunit 1
MLFALGFLFNFCIGGFTGLFLGALNVDVHLHGTDFVVAHFHYTMFGGGGFGAFAAVHYWYPKMFGRMYNFAAAKLSFILIFVGFNVLYFPMFIIGIYGMPRRYHDYVSRPFFDQWQFISSCGAFVLAAGVIIMIVNWIISGRTGKKASDNPWNSTTLEWQVETPPTLFNFNEVPKEIPNVYDYEKTGDKHK